MLKQYRRDQPGFELTRFNRVWVAFVRHETPF